MGATGIEGAPKSPGASTERARETGKTGVDAIGESPARSTVLDARVDSEPLPRAQLAQLVATLIAKGEMAKAKALLAAYDGEEKPVAAVVGLISRRQGGG